MAGFTVRDERLEPYLKNVRQKSKGRVTEIHTADTLLTYNTITASIGTGHCMEKNVHTYTDDILDTLQLSVLQAILMGALRLPSKKVDRKKLQSLPGA